MDVALLGGNLTEDPELRKTGNDTFVANATLATNERYKDSDGELQETVTFHDLVIWGPQAEVFAEYADKGQYMVVRGTHETNQWEDDDGRTRYDQEIKVLDFDFGPRSQSEEAETADEEDEDFEPDDDLPF